MMAAMTSVTAQDSAQHPGVLEDVRVVHTVVPSPLGPITLVAHDGGLSALLLEGSKYESVQGPFGERADDEFDDVQTQLEEYFAGTRTEFDLPLRLHGTPFQVEVWEQLRRIPYGETISYGELAKRVDRPEAARAVGSANGQNPIAIVVPCHRVIGADGSLTGFGGGLDWKRWLLAREQPQGSLLDA